MAATPAAAIAVGPAPAEFTDFDGLLALVQRAFAAHDSRIDPPSSATRATAASLRDMAAAGVLILTTTGPAVLPGATVVGCVLGTPQGDALYLGKLAVDPAWQGRGLGRRLVSALVERARAQGYARVTLGVRLALPENIRLFESLGFVKTGEQCHPGFAVPTSQDMALAL